MFWSILYSLLMKIMAIGLPIDSTLMTWQVDVFNSMFSCILQLNEMSRREWEWEGVGMSYREHHEYGRLTLATAGLLCSLELSLELIDVL